VHTDAFSSEGDFGVWDQQVLDQRINNIAAATGQDLGALNATARYVAASTRRRLSSLVNTDACLANRLLIEVTIAAESEAQAQAFVAALAAASLGATLESASGEVVTVCGAAPSVEVGRQFLDAPPPPQPPPLSQIEESTVQTGGLAIVIVSVAVVAALALLGPAVSKALRSRPKDDAERPLTQSFVGAVHGEGPSFRI
jgi:hypothetical protein